LETQRQSELPSVGPLKKPLLEHIALSSGELRARNSSVLDSRADLVVLTILSSSCREPHVEALCELLSHRELVEVANDCIDFAVGKVIPTSLTAICRYPNCMNRTSYECQCYRSKTSLHCASQRWDPLFHRFDCLASCTAQKVRALRLLSPTCALVGQ